MKYKIKKEHVLLLALCTFVLTLCTHGFFKTFLSFNLVADFCGVLAALSVFVINKFRLRIRKTTPVLFWMLVAFVAGCILVSVVSCYSLRHSLIGCRNYFLFILFGLLLSEINDRCLFDKLITFITRAGTLVCVFSIFQFLLYNHLPEKLLTYRGNSVEGVFEDGVMVFFRVNGLLENTIVFGGFATVILTLLFTKLVVFSSKNMCTIIDVASLVIVCISLAMTFGRIAIIGAVACCCFAFFFALRCKWRYKWTIFASVVLIGALSLVIFRDTTLVSRLIGTGGSAEVSNSAHMQMIKDALKIIPENFFFGVGMGTQGYNRGDLPAIIHDGGWFSVSLDLGTPLALLLAAMMIAVIVYAAIAFVRIKTKRARFITVVTMTLSVYFLCAGFVNTSFTALSNYGLYWCLVGVMIGVIRLERIPAYQEDLVLGEEPLLSVVIVSYNNRDVITDCLDSIREHNDIGSALEVIVVEQSPSDEIYTYLNEQYPDVLTLRAENRGFGAGNNRGVSAAHGKYLLLLNPDTIITSPLFAFACDAFARDEKLGLFGVKLLNADRTDGSSFENLIPFGFLRKARMKLFGLLDWFLPCVMYIQGADMFVRRDLFLSVSGFDEDIFMYCEETDLCTRVRRAGYRIGYFPDHQIVHLQGACTPTKFEGTYEKQVAAFSHVAKKNGMKAETYFAAEVRLQKCKLFLLKLLGKSASEKAQIAEAEIAVLTKHISASE